METSHSHYSHSLSCLSHILIWQAWPRAEPHRPASQMRKTAPELHCEGIRDLPGLPRHPVLAARPGA